MIPRVLEPEVMDTAQEAADYDAMDHSQVNRQFVDDLLDAWKRLKRPRASDRLRVLDVGTGTAQIPIELAGRSLPADILGVDLSVEMLHVGRRNIDRSRQTAIRLQLADAKRLPFGAASMDVVMSNSIIHHIPEPAAVFGQMKRVARRGGLLFVRDLLRPASNEQVESLVATYAADESPRQQQLFRQSLHAALSLGELQSILRPLGIPAECLAQTSDRHWTLAWAA